jgi:N-acetylglucosamine malate deacetylase 1
MKNVLVIAVHPDDETLGCGGTLLKHKALGDRINWLIITKAIPGIRPSANLEEEQKLYIREVALEYKFDEWKQLGFETTQLDKYPIGEIVGSISNYINTLQPKYIYFHHHADVHSDHRITFEAIISATKNFRAPYVEKLLVFETLSETEFAPAIRNNAFVPNVFNDITPYIDKKLEIMKLFTTEQMEEPLPRAMTSIRALARYRGSRIGVEYAEAFMLLFEKY